MIDVVIGVSAARAGALQSADIPTPPAQTVRALIDTGASCTCIDPQVFQALALQATGSTAVLTPSTGSKPAQALTYDVGLMIANGSHQPLFIANMPVLESELLLGQGFHALIGRDVLSGCIFTYNGSIGLFTLAY